MNWDAITGMISGASFDSGAMISPAQARKFLCDAQIIPMILGSKSEVLDVGRASRTFPAHLRRALVARDRGCAWPGCDRPPDWCDGHHIDFWDRDFGLTCLDNGCLLCRHHHTEIHREEWVIRMAADGLPEFIPPSGSTRSRNHGGTRCESTTRSEGGACPRRGDLSAARRRKLDLVSGSTSCQGRAEVAPSTDRGRRLRGYDVSRAGDGVYRGLVPTASAPNLLLLLRPEPREHRTDDHADDQHDEQPDPGGRRNCPEKKIHLALTGVLEDEDQGQRNEDQHDDELCGHPTLRWLPGPYLCHWIPHFRKTPQLCCSRIVAVRGSFPEDRRGVSTSLNTACESPSLAAATVNSLGFASSGPVASGSGRPVTFAFGSVRGFLNWMA